ncbi:MAG: aminoglycoside phosphotransferase family protein [Clostridia bacterium]|nr:aminoglycoside phosphotransferase family protein [Clostridia bacterium]
MSIYLEKVKEPLVISGALKSIIGEGVFEAFRFFDSSVYDEGKGYNTYKIVAEKGAFVMKKYACAEDLETEVKHYRLLSGLPVPELLGVGEDCILMRFVEGDDLKVATDEGIRAAAEALVSIMNAYPMGRGYEMGRYEQYLRRLERRAGCLKDEPELARAFALFYERQKEIPLTLSNGDLLPINVLYDGGRATVIDWEFGGFMPYSLDIARFITHATESGEVTSFRQSAEQKKLFRELVYSGLIEKPARETFDRDLALAGLNECIEILEYYFNEPSAERGKVFDLYYPMAKSIVEELLRG